MHTHSETLFATTGTPLILRGNFLSEQPARIRVGSGGLRSLEPDPTIHRTTNPEVPTPGGGPRPIYAGWGAPRADSTPYGKILRVAGVSFISGLGMVDGARLQVMPLAGMRRFEASGGVDDSSPVGSSALIFELYGDGRLLASSALMHAGDATFKIAAGIGGIRLLELVVRPATKTLTAVATWGDARLPR